MREILKGKLMIIHTIEMSSGRDALELRQYLSEKYTVIMEQRHSPDGKDVLVKLKLVKKEDNMQPDEE